MSAFSRLCDLHIASTCASVLPSPSLRCLLALALLLVSCAHQATAAFVNFDNCLPTYIIDSDPKRLQWVPLFVDARFDTSTSAHNLNITVYGNVTGRQLETELPPPDDPYWQNENETNGKIPSVGVANRYTTLVADFELLSYQAYKNSGEQFCPALIDRSCPLAPDFDANASDPSTLPAFSLGHDFGSSYAFATLASTIQLIGGDANGTNIACVSANITPDLGPRIVGLLCWLPAAILILKGVATLAAAIYSPWGSTDIFSWSSNYGRDEDLLRLVTPGFGDCLQYIQFIVLTGSLTLQYPGFFQPAVSQAAWSLLLFNESFVSGGSGSQSLIDGIYVVNGTYGMSRTSELIGMTSVHDIWACMAVWLLVIAVVVVVLCQLGFLGRWAYHAITNTTEEDLRGKNFPFTTGNMIRLLFNYFILPIVALSLFQLVVASESPTSVVVCAVILLVILILAAGWILKVIFTAKPRTFLFDDMPTVLLYGPLYNTYSDSAAPFALVPVLITFMRGVAIGAVQPSGIAQIIVLAICEVILILTLNAFRPFQGQTSMNAYHTFFAVVRLITILLSIAFVPTLGVGQASKGWIGYAILLLHACVLVFGFFLNAAQTLIEVIARNLGVGSDAQLGATRGSILNWRMLKKRENRAPGARSDRASMTSDAAILRGDEDGRSAGYPGTRSRSMSASSQQLLNRMSGFENLSSDGGYANGGVASPSADENAGQFPAFASGKPALNLKTGEAATETYYRPPRQRTRTMDALTPGAKSRVSGGSDAELAYTDSPHGSAGTHNRNETYEVGGGLHPGRDSPAPAYIRDRADSSDNPAPRTDYAVREVDQYYRGQALSDQPIRRTLKTGPADPEGPAASAQSWFQKFAFGLGLGGAGKQKEKTKGFEVVRSAPLRMPAEDTGRTRGAEELEMVNSPGMRQEPYHDSPPVRQNAALQDQQATGGAERGVSPVLADSAVSHSAQPQQRAFDFGTDGANENPFIGEHNMHRSIRPESETLKAGGPPRRGPSQKTTASSNYDRPSYEDYDEARSLHNANQSVVPSLAPIQSVGGFDLPSRFNSTRSQSGMPGGSVSNPNVDIGETVGGQEWLRQINHLDWSHDNQGISGSTYPIQEYESTPFGEAATHYTSPAPALTQPSTSRTNRGQFSAPNVPPRSSRRTPSGDHSAFTSASFQPGPPPKRTESKTPDHDWTGFDATISPPEDQPAHTAYNVGGPYSDQSAYQDPRPTSYHVSHHRAGDSISRNSLGAEAGLRGESATIEGD